MQLEEKKIKTIANAFELSEDLVKSILDSYMALTLNNILVHNDDQTMFGVIQIDRENKMLKIVDNTQYIDDIFTGNVSPEIFKRFLLFGKNKI